MVLMLGQGWLAYGGVCHKSFLGYQQLECMASPVQPVPIFRDRITFIGWGYGELCGQITAKFCIIHCNGS